MDLLLWIVQALLGPVFAFAGFQHAFRFEAFAARPGMGWARDIGRERMRMTGLLEMAGGTGLVLPAATGILPWLTPLAAAGLAATMLVAALFHLRRGEPVIASAVLLLVAAFIAVGRTFIEPL